MDKYLKEKLPSGKFSDVGVTRSRIMKSIRGRGNKTTECRFRGALVRAKISGWKINFRQLDGTPDFYFPDTKLAIFIDGCFWHGCPLCGHYPKTREEFWRAKIDRNRARDQIKSAALKSKGVEVIRFWEHEIKNSLMQCIEKISTILLDSYRAE